MNDEIFDEIEFEYNETNETTLVSNTLYIPLGSKSVKQIPLAFIVPDNLSPVIVEGFTLAWTKPALAELSEIQKYTRSQDNSSGKNLPYASLRGLLEVGLNNAARIQSNLSLSQFDLSAKSTNSPQPFAYLNVGTKEDVRKALRPILNEWITGFLKAFAERAEVPAEVFDRLSDLQEKDELLTIALLESQVLPWKWSKVTGTTEPRNSYYDYRILVDYVARLIAGKEIFQGIGAMKRLISSSGKFTTGMVELITDPITLTDESNKGKFSLVVRLEVVTYPSLHQPLLKIDISKRRWLSELNPPRFNSGNISGFVFYDDYDERVFSYTVFCRQDKQDKNQQDKKKNWLWVIDKDFEALRRKLELPTKTLDGQDIDGQQIALGKASTKLCQVMLTYRNGLQESKHGIEAGVPEIDKLEAFEKIAEILKPIGFKTFDNYSPVKFKRGESHKLDDTASRMINLPTLLGGALEVIEKSDSTDFTPKYLEGFNDDELNSLLHNNFAINLENIVRSRKSLQFSKPKVLPQTNELKALIEKNQKVIQHLHPNEKPLLVIFYEDELLPDVKMLQAIISVLWGATIEVIANRLPENTHGPRELLPGSNLKAKERSRHRIEAWEPIVKQLASLKRRTFCLVMAREYYPDPNIENKYKHDDFVNKPSTRQALAKMVDCRIQFILPIEKKPKANLLKLDNFFHRVQAALKDLIFAHSGYIEDVKEKVEKWLKDISAECRPKEIIGITIVRKQRGRIRGDIGSTFLPIAMRLTVETGECELCCAYEKGNSLQISPWSKFPDAIAFISQISPVKLAIDKKRREIGFMDFVKQIISTSVNESNHPLVMIDSSNCVQLWPWLADARMDANKINLAQRTGAPLYEHMEQEWKNARLIRIRQDLAPGIIDKKVRKLAETSLEDTRTKKQLTSMYEIPSASSVMKLFRLKNTTNQKSETNQTGCVAYLSVGRKPLHQESRGQSCYRSTEINIPVKNPDGSNDKFLNKAGLEVHQLRTRPPFVGQLPTPNPLEIVVTLRQPNDDPDRLAALVESLRYGFGHYSDWSILPAPLFFERVVRDYISEFAIEDEDTEAEQYLEE